MILLYNPKCYSLSSYNHHSWATTLKQSRSPTIYSASLFYWLLLFSSCLSARWTLHPLPLYRSIGAEAFLLFLCCKLFHQRIFLGPDQESWELCALPIEGVPLLPLSHLDTCRVLPLPHSCVFSRLNWHKLRDRVYIILLLNLAILSDLHPGAYTDPFQTLQVPSYINCATRNNFKARKS